MTVLIVDDEELAVQGILDGVNWEQLRFDKACLLLKATSMPWNAACA